MYHLFLIILRINREYISLIGINRMIFEIVTGYVFFAVRMEC
jgi:hypothetical protein